MLGNQFEDIFEAGQRVKVVHRKLPYFGPTRQLPSGVRLRPRLADILRPKIFDEGSAQTNGTIPRSFLFVFFFHACIYFIALWFDDRLVVDAQLYFVHLLLRPRIEPFLHDS